MPARGGWRSGWVVGGGNEWGLPLPFSLLHLFFFLSESRLTGDSVICVGQPLDFGLCPHVLPHLSRSAPSALLGLLSLHSAQCP